MLSCDVIIWDDNTPLFYFSCKLHSLLLLLDFHLLGKTSTNRTNVILYLLATYSCVANRPKNGPHNSRRAEKKKKAALQIHDRILAGGISPEIKLFPARESLVSDIPARDGKIDNLFFTVNEQWVFPASGRNGLKYV
jgi:hypothetical protein